MKTPHPSHQIVFHPIVTEEVREIEAELDMVIGASRPCLIGYTTLTVVEAPDRVTLYVVAYVSDITEFMNWVDFSSPLHAHILR